MIFVVNEVSFILKYNVIVMINISKNVRKLGQCEIIFGVLSLLIFVVVVFFIMLFNSEELRYEFYV